MDWVVIGIGISTLIAVFGYLVSRIKINENNSSQLRDKLENYKVESTANFISEDKVIKLIGLVSGPLKLSIDELRQDFKDEKRETKNEIEKLSNKIDLLLSAYAKRRKDDDG